VIGLGQQKLFGVFGGSRDALSLPYPLNYARKRALELWLTHVILPANRRNKIWSSQSSQQVASVPFFHPLLTTINHFVQHLPRSATRPTPSTSVTVTSRQHSRHFPSLRRGPRESTRFLDGRSNQQKVATTTRAWAGYEEDSRYRDSFIVFSFLFAQHHSLFVEPLSRERRVFESISTQFFLVKHQHHDL
jgi:hypothetical protein